MGGALIGTVLAIEEEGLAVEFLLANAIPHGALGGSE